MQVLWFMFACMTYLFDLPNYTKQNINRIKSYMECYIKFLMTWYLQYKISHRMEFSTMTYILKNLYISGQYQVVRHLDVMINLFDSPNSWQHTDYSPKYNFQISFPGYDLINIMSSNMYLKFESE